MADEVRGRGGAAVLREGLRSACAAQPARRPARKHAGARVGTLLLEAVGPVEEHGAGAGEEVALPAASGKREGKMRTRPVSQLHRFLEDRSSESN